MRLYMKIAQPWVANVKKYVSCYAFTYGIYGALLKMLFGLYDSLTCRVYIMYFPTDIY